MPRQINYPPDGLRATTDWAVQDQADVVFCDHRTQRSLIIRQLRHHKSSLLISGGHEAGKRKSFLYFAPFQRTLGL
jgi:hypothetical protein